MTGDGENDLVNRFRGQVPEIYQVSCDVLRAWYGSHLWFEGLPNGLRGLPNDDGSSRHREPVLVTHT